MCLWIFRQAVACRYTNQWAISWNMSIEIFLLQLSDKVDFSYYADAWLGLGATKKKKQKLQVHIYVHNTQIYKECFISALIFVKNAATLLCHAHFPLIRWNKQEFSLLCHYFAIFFSAFLLLLGFLQQFFCCCCCNNEDYPYFACNCCHR